MNEVKIPAPGRIVHYYPNGADELIPLNFPGDYPGFWPAISVDGTDLSPCLSVFTKLPESPVVLRWSIQHKSISLPGQPYWDWPEIK